MIFTKRPSLKAQIDNISKYEPLYRLMLIKHKLIN